MACKATESSATHLLCASHCRRENQVLGFEGLERCTCRRVQDFETWRYSTPAVADTFEPSPRGLHARYHCEQELVLQIPTSAMTSGRICSLKTDWHVRWSFETQDRARHSCSKCNLVTRVYFRTLDAFKANMTLLFHLPGFFSTTALFECLFFPSSVILYQVLCRQITYFGPYHRLCSIHTRL